MNEVSREIRLAVVERALNEHMRQCEKRSARLEKVVWLAFSTILVVLGVLLKALFHL